MFLNIKIFEETIVISTSDMLNCSIDFLRNTVLDGIYTYKDRESIIIENNLYTALLLLNEHYSLIIL